MIYRNYIICSKLRDSNILNGYFGSIGILFARLYQYIYTNLLDVVNARHGPIIQSLYKLIIVGQYRRLQIICLESSIGLEFLSSNLFVIVIWSIAQYHIWSFCLFVSHTILEDSAVEHYRGGLQYYHNNYIMQSETLFALVGKIRVQRIRLTPQPACFISCPWTAQDSDKFEELVQLYGADFGLIQAYFPQRSRKQIRRKYQEIEQRQIKRTHRMELKRDEERRKNYFDEEILETNLMRWPKKPNIAESSSSEDSL